MKGFFLNTKLERILFHRVPTGHEVMILASIFDIKVSSSSHSKVC